MNINMVISEVRRRLPDLSAVLAFVNTLPWPVDPVVDAFLTEHLGVWCLGCAARTDVGSTRSINEDGYFVCREDRAFVVLDGMGASCSGEWATDLAIEVLGRCFPRGVETTQVLSYEDGLSCPLAKAMEAINAAMLAHAEANPQAQGGGATAAGLFFEGDRAFAVHVGDCRVYRLRDGVLTQITEDHTLLTEYRKLELEPDPNIMASYQNIIIRALGITAEVEVDVSLVWPQRGDLFLLTSDGLPDAVEDDDIIDVLSGDGGLEERCGGLIDAALGRGAKDNLVAVLVGVGGGF